MTTNIRIKSTVDLPLFQIFELLQKYSEKIPKTKITNNRLVEIFEYEGKSYTIETEIDQSIDYHITEA